WPGVPAEAVAADDQPVRDRAGPRRLIADLAVPRSPEAVAARRRAASRTGDPLGAGVVDGRLRESPGDSVAPDPQWTGVPGTAGGRDHELGVLFVEGCAFVRARAARARRDRRMGVTVGRRVLAAAGSRT